MARVRRDGVSSTHTSLRLHEGLERPDEAPGALAGPGGLVVDPDGYLPSFTTATNRDSEQEEKGGSNSVSSNRWWAPYSDQSTLNIAELTCLR